MYLLKKMLTSVICAIIKDETEYLEEWIQYHLEIGFNHIFLYQDRGSDSHKYITDKFKENVTLHLLDDERYDFLYENAFFRQTTLYHFFMVEYHQKYNWVAFIDVDEFVTFTSDFTLQDLLLENQYCPSFLLEWKVLGADGRIEKCDKVLGNYNTDVSKLYEFGHVPTKMFINLYDTVPLDWCHNPAIPSKTLYKYSDNKVWLDHYYTKSWDDWCTRFVKKGDVCPGNRDIIEFFRMNSNMLPAKYSLFERLYSKNNFERIQCDFVHVFTPEINDFLVQEINDDPFSNVYDVLAYTLSFIYLRKMGRRVKLYCSQLGKEMLSHLEYDKITIIPDEYKNKGGLVNMGLLYALENEPITTCFVHGDCFLRDKIILGFLETNKQDLIVLQSEEIDKNNIWDYTVNKKESFPSFLTPGLVDNTGTYDTSILMFHNSILKDEFIAEYKNVLQKYHGSLYEKFCVTCGKIMPDRCLFNNLLKQIVGKIYSCKEIIGVKHGFQCREERIKEKIDFFKILHLTHKSKYFNKEKCIRNMMLTLKKESLEFWDIINNKYNLIK